MFRDLNAQFSMVSVWSVVYSFHINLSRKSCKQHLKECNLFSMWQLCLSIAIVPKQNISAKQRKIKCHSNGQLRIGTHLFLSAYLRNCFLCWDRWNRDVMPTLDAAMLCSSRAGHIWIMDTSSDRHVIHQILSASMFRSPSWRFERRTSVKWGHLCKHWPRFGSNIFPLKRLFETWINQL